MFFLFITTSQAEHLVLVILLSRTLFVGIAVAMEFMPSVAGREEDETLWLLDKQDLTF
jgi:hypothetical protein